MKHFKALNEQVVVLFGASTGMGRQTALCFAREGAKVVAAARSGESLESLVAEIRQQGGQATAITADAAVFDEVEAVAAHAIATFGGLDTWVHFAGASLYATFENTLPEEFRRIIDVNLVGAAYGAMAAMPQLRSQKGGAIIEISSVEAEVSLPLQSAYAASKHGIKGFLDSLRMEVHKDKLPINVVNIMPAGIDTTLFEHAESKMGVKPKPVAPVYRAEHVAKAVLFAATHPARELYVGGAAKAYVLLKRLFPRLTDAYLTRTAFRQQLTKEPESLGGTVFEAEGDDTRISGGFKSRRRSLYTWLETHPKTWRAIQGGLVLAAAATVYSRRKIRAA